MRLTKRALLILHAIVGTGAIAGGMAAILNPTSPLGMPASALKNSPFTDFLIPGIILFAVIGLGNILSAITMALKSKHQGYISSVFSWALVIWIIVQVLMLQGVHFLHILFFAIGLFEAILSAVMLYKQSSFPFNFITGFLEKGRKEQA